jgi:hypothetical protein
MAAKGHPGLELLLAVLISDGARDIEVECSHGEWWVSVVQGNTGLGVARYATEQEKRQADRALDRLRRDKSIDVNGKRYRLSFRYSESFEEPCWRIRVAEARSGDRPTA